MYKTIVGIYKIENKINGKCYIGQSRNLKKRLMNHKTTAFNTNSEGYEYPLYRAIRKYGIKNFSFTIIEECLIEELNDKEIYWMGYYNSLEDGYNQIHGGNALHPIKLTYENADSLINDLIHSKETVRELAIKYDITHQMVYNVKNGKSWRKDGLTYPLRELRPADSSISRKQLNGKISVKNTCIGCGKPITYNSTRCSNCNNINQRTVERPDSRTLVEEIYELGFSDVGKKYGVNGNTIKKWCRYYDLPDMIKEVRALWEEWNDITPKEKRKVTSGQVEQIDKATGEVLNVYDSAVEAAIALGDRNYNKHISSVCSGSRKSAYGFKWRRVV